MRKEAASTPLTRKDLEESNRANKPTLLLNDNAASIEELVIFHKKNLIKFLSLH